MVWCCIEVCDICCAYCSLLSFCSHYCNVLVNVRGRPALTTEWYACILHRWVLVCCAVSRRENWSTLVSGGECIVKQYVYFTHVCSVNNYLPNIDYCCCVHDAGLLCCRYHHHHHHLRKTVTTRWSSTWTSQQELERRFYRITTTIIIIIILIAIMIILCSWRRSTVLSISSGMESLPLRWVWRSCRRSVRSVALLYALPALLSITHWRSTWVNSSRPQVLVFVTPTRTKITRSHHCDNLIQTWLYQPTIFFDRIIFWF